MNESSAVLGADGAVPPFAFEVQKTTFSLTAVLGADGAVPPLVFGVQKTTFCLTAGWSECRFKTLALLLMRYDKALRPVV